MPFVTLLSEALANVPYRIRCEVAAALEAECATELAHKNRSCSQDLTGKTIFIEAARGGPNGTGFPLTPPRGYQSAFNQLSSDILDRAVILYIWVDPSESRRKNIERGLPDGQGSILNHSAPWEVMVGDYGCDDMAWLQSESDKPDTVRVDRIVVVTNEAGERRFATKTWHLPVARFDNRSDRTTFVRKPTADWQADEVAGIHDELARALGVLAARRAELG